MSSPYLHAITCSKCGAALDPNSGGPILVCSYCRTSHVFTPPPGAGPTARNGKFPVLPLALAGTALLVLSGAALAFTRTLPNAPDSSPMAPGAPKPVLGPAEPSKPTEANAGDPLATYSAGQAVDIHWGSRWWPGRILERDGSRYRISYEGWSSSWDEWVGPDRLRKRQGQP